MTRSECKEIIKMDIKCDMIDTVIKELKLGINLLENQNLNIEHMLNKEV